MKTLASVTLFALWLAAGPARATPPAAFTATYQVEHDGAPLGRATVTLAPAGEGVWTYQRHLKGTAGLAGMLGAQLQETSRFRWQDDRPQALGYDYRLDTGFKQRQRHLQVAQGTVTVVDDGSRHSYPAVPGMVERSTEALAIGVALRSGAREIALPVAVKQAVQTQRFVAHGREAVTVPAGRFDALKVERTDADRGFTAWYVPARFPVPVQVTQRDGGNLTMKLVDYHPH